MSAIPKDTIEVIAQRLGISNLSPDVFPSLASDVEYRLREIMQVFFFRGFYYLETEFLLGGNLKKY